MRTLGIDIETYSEVDIKEAGAHRYIDDPSFQVMLFAYSIDGGDVQIVDLMLGESLPEEVTAAIKDDRVTKTAWNAVFERTALSKFFGAELSPKSWDCTMIRAARAGLPLSLDQCCEALKLPADKAKMKVGKELIKFFCVPTKTTLRKGPMARKRNMPQNDFEKWSLFKDYCVRDVESEQLIRSMLMHVEVTPMEKALYCLDQEINDRGVLVDLTMAQNAVNIYQARTAALMEEARALSGLENPRSVAQLKTLFGVESLNKKTIGGVRASATEEQRRILDIRQELGKTPLKKYDVMLAAACHDGRVRGLHQFYGTRTGRWAGRLLQVQNLPQNHLEGIEVARQFLVDGDADSLELFYGNVSDTMSQLIRTALIAKPGRRFIVCDFSAIEARVIAWLAGEQWRLDLFRKGGDIYCESASRIYGVPVEKHGRNSGLRQKGKIAELACGYGGGTGALKAFGADKVMTEDEMAKVIFDWRNASPNITKLWTVLEKFFMKAMEDGRPHMSRGLVFAMDHGAMTIQLPSGRKIFYPEARIGVNRFGSRSIVFKGVEQTTRKWQDIETYGGKLTENIVQAIARDCLAITMLRLRERGYEIVFHVHDEAIIEATPDQTLADVEAVFSIPMPWERGEELPLVGAGYETPFYLKD